MRTTRELFFKIESPLFNFSSFQRKTTPKKLFENCLGFQNVVFEEQIEFNFRFF